MDDFDDYAIPIDSECYEQDFDDVDLYGTKMVEDEDDGFADKLGIKFE